MRSSATSLLSAQAGYRVGPHSRVVVELFNLLNERASDIDYFYTSRLRDEPSGVLLTSTRTRRFRAVRV